jgi:CDP-glucose 4,6-dehydratase
MFSILTLDTKVQSIIANINDPEALGECVRATRPEVIFHLAAQALVRPGYDDPLGTFETNILGTANLLQAACSLSEHCDVVVVTSDKCYSNREVHHHYVENDPLGGRDPYSASKACAEIVTASFRDSYCGPAGPHSHIHIATTRAGNVIGGGDWAIDRLIPDTIKAWLSSDTMEVRSPSAVRPWQHVLEPLSGYLILAQAMNKSRDYCRAWNFGPDKAQAISVQDLLKVAATYCPELKYTLATNKGPHEAGLLMLNASAANELLNWKPVWELQETLQQTYAWYEAWHNGDDMMAFTNMQIDLYIRTSDMNSFDTSNFDTSNDDTGHDHG